MGQNSSFSDAMHHEAMKTLANAHCQKCLPGKDIALKTTQTFLTNSCELYRTIFKLISESWNLRCQKISKFFVRFFIELVPPTPLI